MLGLPIIKIDFLFENSQDFNQTTHARSQHPIVFVDIIMSRSHHASFCSTTQAQTQKTAYAYFERWEKCLRIVWNASFLLFFKMATCGGYDRDSKRSYL